MAKIKKLAIILPDSKAKASVVITYAKAVYAGMNSNAATFTDPPITMVNFKAAITAAENADVPEADRSANTDAELEKKLKTLREMLLTLSTYVLFVANGDRSIGALSGFELNKEETTKKTPGEFRAVFVRPGADAGTAIVNVEERAGNTLFIVQLWVEDKWVMIDAFNTLTFTVEELPAGSSRLRIYGKKGKTKSPAVELIVRAS